jgi:hypothetical protein
MYNVIIIIIIIITIFHGLDSPARFVVSLILKNTKPLDTRQASRTGTSAR